MKNYVVYYSDGSIYGVYGGNPPVSQEIPSGCSVLEASGNVVQEDFWVNGGALLPRIDLSLSLFVDGSPVADELILEPDQILRIQNIPVATKVYSVSGKLMVNDGFIEWTSRTPGRFAFEFYEPAYKDLILYATVASV